MVPTQTAQSYAAIAHAAAAAAQSNSFNQQRHNVSASNSSNHLNDFNGISTNHNQPGEQNGTINTNYIGGGSGSVNNLFGGQSNSNSVVVPNKTQSYNNPGFFDSTSYTIVSTWSRLKFN